MTDELKSPKEIQPKQPQDVLNAYRKAKAKLESQGLSVVGTKGKKQNITIASYAFNEGLLSDLTGKEADVYRKLLDGLPFQYRSNETIAEEAGVGVATVKRAIRKLKDCSLLATQRRIGNTAVMVFTDTTKLSTDQIKTITDRINSDPSERIGHDREIERSKQSLCDCSLLKSNDSAKGEERSRPVGAVASFSLGGEIASCTVASTAADPVDAAARCARSQRVSDQQGTEYSAETEDAHSRSERLATPIPASSSQQPVADSVLPPHAPVSELTEVPLQASGVTLPTGLGGVPSEQNHCVLPLEAQFNAEARRYQQYEAQKSASKFDCHVQALQLQRQCCALPQVHQVQQLITSQLKAGTKAMDLCKELNRQLVLYKQLKEVRRYVISQDKHRDEITQLLQPYVRADKVMLPVLVDVCVLRCDHPDQVAEWIKYAKLKAKTPGYLGLLPNIILKAQRIKTAELYPEVAQQMELFLDEQLIGTGSIRELENADMNMDAQGFELLHAAENSRKMLLRDYTGVLVSQLADWKRRDGTGAASQLPEMLRSMLSEGDSDNSQVPENAPSRLRVACLKYRLKFKADLLMQQSNPVQVYLPHLIHERQKPTANVAA